MNEGRLTSATDPRPAEAGAIREMARERAESGPQFREVRMYAARRIAKKGFTLVEILIVVIILGILIPTLLLADLSLRTAVKYVAAAYAVVWLVTYVDRAEVDIGRGENSGRKIAYTHIVTGRQVLGMWEPNSGEARPSAEVSSG